MSELFQPCRQEETLRRIQERLDQGIAPAAVIEAMLRSQEKEFTEVFEGKPPAVERPQRRRTNRTGSKSAREDTSRVMAEEDKPPRPPRQRMLF